jgi:hypothetical protein
LRELSHYEGWFSKSPVHEWISLVTRRWTTAFAADAEGVRTTAEEGRDLDFVNIMLSQVTNVG